MPVPRREPLHERHSVRQFVKFCIVGASSTVISFGIFNILYLKYQFPLVPAVTIAFLLSVMNGFLWNRHWTFKEAKHKAAHEQYVKFLAVNVVGWFLNTSIVVLIVAHYTSGGNGIFGDQHQFMSVVWAIVAGQHRGFNKWLVNGALAAATCVVVFWNFFANRLWTFKH